ncbi:MAG: RNA polymerase sigma factor, partial [Actinomycetota bacterium]
MAQSEVTQAQHDQRLLQQLASGESSAFWELWLGCKDRLYRICLHFAGNSQQDAEDILSEVMLKAFEKLPSHACNIRDFKCWMAKFARNTCIDVVRKRRREQMQVCELETEPAMHSVQGSPPTWKGEVSVTALLEKLSPCQLAAFICRF